METRTLADLKPGESGVVAAVGGEDALHRHLLDMGITPGVTVLLQKNRPHGRPGGNPPARLRPDSAPGRRKKNHPPVSVGKDRRQPGFSDERQLL